MNRLCGLLFVVLFALKVVGLSSMSWLYVYSPLFFSGGITLVIFVVGILLIARDKK